MFVEAMGGASAGRKFATKRGRGAKQQKMPLPKYIGMKWREATAKRRTPCTTSLSSGFVMLSDLTAAPVAIATPAVPVSSGLRAMNFAAALAACIFVLVFQRHSSTVR